MSTAAERTVEEHTRRRRLWRFLRAIVRPVLWLRFRSTSIPAQVDGPFLLVSNHNTDWDPLIVGASFGEPLYYVCSEHLLRAGLAGRIIRRLFDPIPRMKSGSAADTVMAMLRRLKKGHNVCVFPEGNRSWDGVTMPFLPSIGKLARSGGASLVTYRLEGAYLASPRWSGNSARRGRVSGHVVHVYSPEELKAMTPAAIAQCIADDLREDAYERQRKDPIRFEGRHLAEHMETLLFLCPKCGRLHTLQSRGNTVRCWKCGFSFNYLPTGFLSGEGIPYDNLRDWKKWQDDEIRRLCDEATDRPIFTDTDMRTDEVQPAAGTVPVGKGDMSLYRDRLELPGVTIPVADITGISLRGAQDIYFSTAEHHYLVRSGYTRCTLKYLTACSHLNGGRDYSV